MTDTLSQPETDSLTRLSDVLNKLTRRGSLTISDVAAERQKLADMALSFNGASTPVAEKLAEALPGMTDYGSRWIAARMLKETGLKDEKQGEFALDTLASALATEKDSGSRHMLAALIRDIGVAHEALAVPAAAAISSALGREKDAYAHSAEKQSLMTLGMKYEAAGAVATAGVSKALLEETDSYMRIMHANNLRDLGLKYASQSGAAVTSLAKALAKESDTGPLRQIAQNIARISDKNPATVPQAVSALTAGVVRAQTSDAVAANSTALMSIGEKHPLPVIVAMEKDYAAFREEGLANKDKRRNYICDLSRLAGLGATEALACSKVLLNALNGEPEAHHRRLIIGGLMTCARSGIDETEIREGLKTQLNGERDRETRDTLERSLRSLGYVKPYRNVLTLPV
jgi:hypothetical protein